MEELKEGEAYCLLLPDKAEFDTSASDKEDLARMLSIRP